MTMSRNSNNNSNNHNNDEFYLDKSILKMLQKNKTVLLPQKHAKKYDVEKYLDFVQTAENK